MRMTGVCASRHAGVKRGPRASQRQRRLALTLLCGIGLPCGLGLTSTAQVVNDGSLGSTGAGVVASSTDGAGTDYFLGEADGELVGGRNLFHSLSRLDLARDDRLTYQGSSSIENLVTRVTGGASSIDGTIRSEIPDANLFLINPAGVVFGENAELDVSGSVVISTAHEVGLGTSGRFDTRGAGGDVLTIDPPERFGFVDPPAPIVLDGSRLRGADDTAIALVGGDLTLSGSADGQRGLLGARSGRVDLASLASPGAVVIDRDGAGDLLVAEGTRLGTIQIRDDFVVTTSGIVGNPIEEGFIAGAGPVFVRAHDLTLDEAAIQTLTVSDQAAGVVSIELTGDLRLIGRPGGLGSLISSASDVDIPVPPDLEETQVPILRRDFPGFVFRQRICGAIVCGYDFLSGGRAGDIDISARNLELSGGSSISSRSLAGGDAGTITIDLAGDVSIEGIVGSSLLSGIFSSSRGSGNPGTIRLTLASGTLSMDDYGVIVIENGDGSLAENVPGRIEIEASALDLAGSARIDTSTRGAGQGGDILIDIAGRARMRGVDETGDFTGISSLAQPGSTGAAGTITLRARSVEIGDGAQIAARPEADTATGDAGSIRIEAADDLVMRNGTISAESPSVDGGNIEISAGRLVDLSDSAITTSVRAGDGSGGNVRIEPGPLAVRLARSQIVAQAQFGAGGNIFIETNLLLDDAASLIDAGSAFGQQQGTETIQSPQGEINIQQPELATPPVDASALLDEPCAARDPSAASSLVFEPDPGPFVEDAEYLSIPLAPLMDAARADEREVPSPTRSTDRSLAQVALGCAR